FNNGALVSAVNGFIDVTATTGFTLNGTATIQTTGTGIIRFSADDAAITATATINAGLNTVTFQQANTTARNIDLGLGITAGTLGLSSLELNRVTAGALIIGRADNTGNITLTAPIAP